jgi:hypothetical protein
MRARARDQQLAPPERISGWSAPTRRPAGRAPPSRREPYLVRPILRGSWRSGRLQPANSSMAPTTPTRTPCRGAGRQTRRRRRARRRRQIPVPPHNVFSHCLSGAPEPRMYTFPSSLAGTKDQPQPWRRSEDRLPSSRGSAAPPSRWRVEVG